MTVTKKLNVVDFIIYQDNIAYTYTLISEKINVAGIMNSIKMIVDTYKGDVSYEVNEIHLQNYNIDICSGLIEKDIEIHFQKIYDSDYTIVLH